MDANTYQELALRTAAALEPRQRLLNAAHELDTAELQKELGDVLWYAALACNALGVQMGDVMEANIAKLRRRYPEGFSAERSRNRGES